VPSRIGAVVAIEAAFLRSQQRLTCSLFTSVAWFLRVTPLCERLCCERLVKVPWQRIASGMFHVIPRFTQPEAWFHAD
jgi:hypothetical protein